MAADPAPEQSRPRADRQRPRPAPPESDDREPGGNAGPDCFWPTPGLRLPAPRVPLSEHLDELPKPPRTP